MKTKKIILSYDNCWDTIQIKKMEITPKQYKEIKRQMKVEMDEEYGVDDVRTTYEKPLVEKFETYTKKSESYTNGGQTIYLTTLTCKEGYHFTK